MGSSKKHKEKRDKKKHKKNRSRSRERESHIHKKSHKSSHKKEKRRSPEYSSPVYDYEHFDSRSKHNLEEDVAPEDIIVHIRNEEKSPVSFREPSPDDEFDIDKLLESKLSEKTDIAPVKRVCRKKISEAVIEKLKKRQNIEFSKEDSLEKFANDQLLEEHTVSSAIAARSTEEGSPHKGIEIPFITDITEVKIKEEPPEEENIVQETEEEKTEPQLSLSVSETNKLRAKLGLKPLEVKNEIPEKTEPQLSLSINETNKLRAKLGLKPLEVKNEIPGLSGESSEKDTSKPAEIFVKTENIREIQQSEALREKLKVMREKRAIEEKLKKTKGIADSDSEEESAVDWVIKHQKILLEKERAEKRAKMLEEMDEEFGVGALVEEEFKKSKAYTSKHLKGLTIGHDIEAFKEGTPVILTLKDKGVLEEEEDILENVNIVDNERFAKNVENKKKKPDYQPYEEPEYDEFGILKKKNLLSKYDEEIEGAKKKTFKIGSAISSSSHSTREQELEMIRMKLKQQNKISLEMPEFKIANEYYTPADMVQFKKPKKKKKKIRKVTPLKADDLLEDAADDGENDLGSRKKKRITDEIPYSTETHNMEVDEDLSNIVIDEDQAEKELYSALNKARKLKERKVTSSAPEKVLEILNKTNSAENHSTPNPKGANIELNSIAEFCRTLGEIPTYGMSGNRDEEADEMMDLERELLEEKQKQELEAQNRGAWNEVDIDEKPAEISVRENEPILEEEPDINHGIAGALKLAMKKGYLDKETKKASNAPRTSQLQAQSYTIEEKFYEDDKFGKRDRYTGPVQEFREKTNYKPDVKLEYIDDSGRLLTAKEAFRYLSHKFHGKGPGKNKVDKRMKKLEQDTRLKQMSSTDTPLNTVKLLQAKQKETQSPYIVLSGGNKTLTQTMISKTKL